MGGKRRRCECVSISFPTLPPGTNARGIGGIGADTEGIGGIGADMEGIGGMGADTEGIGGRDGVDSVDV